MGTPAGSRIGIVAAAVLFSTGGAAIKACALSGTQVACLRSGIAALALILTVPAARRRWTPRTLLVGCAYAATMVFFVLSNKMTTAASTIFLQATAPLYILLLAPWILREPVRRRDVVFMTAMAAGLALFFMGTETARDSAPSPIAGNLLGFMSGLSWALTVTGLRWAARGERAGAAAGEESALSMVCAGNTIACLVCLPWALPLPAGEATDWIVVGYLGLFQIALAYVFLTAGIRRVPALEASLLLLAEPVLNPIWAWLVQGETAGPWTLAGGTIIVGATAMKTWGDALRARSVDGGDR